MTKRSILSRAQEYSDAFISSIIRYGERDCIVRVFLRHEGRMVLFYKNGMGTKHGGAIQAPSFARVGFTSASEQKMRRLYSADIDPARLPLDLKSFAYLSYLAEVLERLLPEGESAEPIFEVLEETAFALIKLGPEPSLLRAFELKILDFCGYLPDFFDFEQGPDFFYDPLSCRLEHEAKDHSFLLKNSALQLAVAMLSSPIGSVLSQDNDDLLCLGRIFRSRLSLLGIKELKSVNFLKQLSAKNKFSSGVATLEIGQ